MRRIAATVLLCTFISGSFPLFAASSIPVRAPQAMVASTSEIASQIGVDVMQQGGNAVDAAVAVALALTVTWPEAGNLGGGGFMMIRTAAGEVDIIDYRERAPLGATRDMYLDANGKVVENLSTRGYKAVGVPGTVAGLAMAREKHGRLPWARLVEPARKLAADGFTVNYHLARSLKAGEKNLAMFPDSNRIFLRDGKFYQEGERLVQPELAATLKRLRNKGPREFYEGETAKMIVRDMQANGGIITAADLKGYEPTLRKPLRGTYRGHEIITMPPPSSGGTALLSMLNMLEKHDVTAGGHNSAASIHLLAEVMRRAFADRASFLGDRDFVKVPVDGLISKKYAEQLGSSFGMLRASKSTDIRAGNPAAYESPDTTHFTIIDREGNVVTNTYTLNRSFGSLVTAKGTGLLLNNEMDDFTSKPGVPNAYNLIQGESNSIEPKKRPLSSMTPTIVLTDGRFHFAIGSPGGPTIINTVLQVIVNVIDHKMSLQGAIDAPRVHHQWLPDQIYWEPLGINADTRAILEKMGHSFREKAEFMGDAQGVMVDLETGMRLGAADPRLGGVAVGY